MTSVFRRKQWIGSLALGAMACVLAGCGGSGDTTDLSGTVTIAGEPLPDDATGVIAFAPQGATEEEEVVMAPIQNGRYEANNVPVGDVNVTFEITRPGEPQVSERTGEEFRPDINLVPPRVATGVPLTIDGEKSTQDFDL